METAGTDPLKHFEWDRLYELYDKRCVRFDKDAKYLRGFEPKPRSDRDLYYELIRRFDSEIRSAAGLAVETYEGFLYWKFYSTPGAVRDICEVVWNYDGGKRADLAENLRRLSGQFPPAPGRDLARIREIMRLFDGAGVFGLRSCSAIPTRTTFLHLVYPETVPIIDKMVRIALGRDDASDDLDLIPQIWDLADNHFDVHTRQHPRETRVRWVEMGLWIIR